MGVYQEKSGFLKTHNLLVKVLFMDNLIGYFFLGLYTPKGIWKKHDDMPSGHESISDIE